MDKQRNLFTNELEPVAKHRGDIVECSDGTTQSILDAFEDIEGVYHSCEDDRLEREVEIVQDVLTKVVEWNEEYATSHTDFVGAYAHIVDETSHDWFGIVESWVEDNYPHHKHPYTSAWDKDVIEKITEYVCENLEGSYDCEEEYCSSEYAAYSGSGCCLWGFDIGEQEEQIDISCHDELQELHNAGRLDDCLDQLEREFCISRSRRREKNEETGKYEEVGRKTYMPYPHHAKHPCFEIYTMPGGRWDFIVPVSRMKELVAEAICALCRK